MPLKTFLAKSRRKSSGNVFEDVDTAVPQEGSFRVLTRPYQNAERSHSEGPGSPYKSFEGGYKKDLSVGNLYSGASLANSGYNDNSSSSARLSSTSTLPSSTDAPPDDISTVRMGPRPHLTVIPKDEAAFSVRAGGRTFSFGTKAKQVENDREKARDRGLTESSYTSTIAPPRLESSLAPMDESEGFGDLFGSIGKPKSATFDGTQRAPASNGNKRASTYDGNQRASTYDGKYNLADSWNNDDIKASSPTPLLSSPLNHSGNVSPIARQGGRGTRGSKSTENLASVKDEDANLVLASIAASRALDRSAATPNSRDYDSDFTSSPIQWTSESTNTTPRAKSFATVVDHARAGKKVMTPAEFERYKHETPAHEAGEEDEEDEYDDDEEEKSRQLSKQRRRQEAHLSVYRQQMMKVTGESNAPRPPPAQLTTPALEEGRQDSDNEDDDIPLAILQAHGFPSKSRPPSQFGDTSRGTALPRSSASPSLAGESTTGNQRHGSLPVFARGLPQDPYNSNLHTPSNRQSMGFGHQGPAGQPPGLVGVIVGEERARAARRASPNKLESSTYQGPQVPQMGGFDFPKDATQAQLTAQMQQMMQFQMQWMEQMMQMQGVPPGQMSQFDPYNPAAMRPMSVYSGQYQQDQQNHPQQLLYQQQQQQYHQQQHHHQQRHSYAPSMQSRGYAPSIAPSERSNIGLPTRYRPVSQVPALAVSAPSDTSSIRKSAPLQARVTPEIDEDDEEAWEELRKKKEKKKSLWKMKKSNLPADYLDY